MTAFRSVSFWQSALMTLPEDAFFELMRSALGTIKTPFNKQNLLEDLSAFIGRPEIQETMAAYIDDRDRRVIAALALLGEPATGELESFFSGEYSYAELQEILLNLEERLIVYRFRDRDFLRLALNPRLENILAPIACSTEILFPSEDSAAGPAPAPAMNGRILAALSAFLFGGELFLRENIQDTDLFFRKKMIDEGGRIFPGLDLESLWGGLLILGLFKPRGEYLSPDETRLAAWKVLSSQDRYDYLAAGIAVFLHRGLVSYLGRGVIRNTARLVRRISLALDNAVSGVSGGSGKTRNSVRVLPETTALKLASLFRREEEKSWASMGTGPLPIQDPAAGSSRPGKFSGELPPSAELLRAMVLAGLFSESEADGKKCYRASGVSGPEAETPEGGAKKAGPRIAMDSDSSCILYPEIDFASAMDLAAFSSVEETGAAVRFSISRESVIRGFNRGYTARFMWELLERLSEGRTGTNLKWRLEDWEKRYHEVSLDEGVVLTLSGERSYLAETGPLKTMIKQSIAPGVYLLCANAEEAARALHNAGVDIVARRVHPLFDEAGDFSASPVFSPLGETETRGFDGVSGALSSSDKERTADKTDKADSADKADKTNKADKTDGAQAIKEKFRAVLSEMQLSRQEQEELEARIERRLILSETQLRDTSLRYEKLEARSLDYVGKTGIAKQAILSGSLLEVHWAGGNHALGIPETLEKKGGETALVLKPREGELFPGGGERLKIPLGKISLLRRIKKSIFGE